MNLPKQAIAPRTDLREMLRAHIVSRGLACMATAAARREGATASPEAMAAYRTAIRAAVRGFYGALPAGAEAPPPAATPAGTFAHPGFRIENVLFETYPGWQVNATVYVPTEFQPPFPVVIVPVGHSGKQFEAYQLPCQYFARAGYLAVCFDPPGQASEKQPGNDHFNDGVRDYLIGRTSSRYFISDAIRCIDYASTRADTDLSRGVAMTGVSGGGTTTTFAALLDDRIAVIGPACCVTPLVDLDIAQCYAGCPETHMFRRYAEGIDEVDLICAAAPMPCLLMAGETDEVFRIEDTRRLANEAVTFYTAAGAPEEFAFSVDPGGHGYPLAQAHAFARFMNRWLRREPDRPVPELPDATFALLPYEQLQCHPRADVNMRTLAVAEADRLSANRDRFPRTVRTAAARLAGVTGPAEVPEAEVGAPFQVWTHNWHALMLRPEPGIELPATLLTARRGGPAPAILHMDDGGRHRLLYRQGPLGAAIRFLDRDRPGFSLLTVDLRGWGDTAPAMHPYEMAGWGSLDRYAAYASAALGDPLMAMRVRDALAALAWLRARPEVDPERIVIAASGLAGLVALHVAAIDADVAGVVALEGLSSFRSLIAAEHYPWPADAFMPNALRHYDLPDLAAAVPAPVHLHNLCDGAGNAADDCELRNWRAVPNATVTAEADGFSLAGCIEKMAADGAAYRRLRRGEPFLWPNPKWQPVSACLDALLFQARHIADAEARWQCFAPLLETLFPELRSSHGIIDSPLLPAPRLAERVLPPDGGRLLVKADHALPVAGSIKARGGIYAVLHFAEKMALKHGLLANQQDDYRRLLSSEARAVSDLRTKRWQHRCTLDDGTLYRHLRDMYETEGIEVEPSAAAGCGVPRLLCASETGRDYLRESGLVGSLHQATHVVWTTGGLFVPSEQHRKYRAVVSAVLKGYSANEI